MFLQLNMSLETIHLALHAMLLLLLLTSSGTYAVQCICTDCINAPTCEGEKCYSSIFKSSISKGCYNDTSNCGVLSEVLMLSIECCVSEMCNENLQPSLPTSDTSITSPTPDPHTLVPSSGSPLSPILKPYTSSDHSTESTIALSLGSVPTSPTAHTNTEEPNTGNPLSPILIPSQQPTNPQPSDGDSVTTTTPRAETTPSTHTTTTPSPAPIVSPSCHRTDPTLGSANPICSMSSAGCYTTWRRRHDGTKELRRGCSMGSCEEENRNRKIKTCCYTSFCNNNTVHPFPDSNSSSEEKNENNSVQERTNNNITQAPNATSAPAVTTVTTTTAMTTQPTTASYEPPKLLPVSDEEPTILPYFLECACDDCSTVKTCHSNQGCAYRIENVDGNITTTRTCVTDSAMCEDNLIVCCRTKSFCNGPVSDTNPTIGGSDVASTDVSIITSSSHPSTDPTTTPTSDTMATTQPPAQVEFPYITIGTVLAVVVGITSLVVMVLIMIILWARYKREERRTLRKQSHRTPAILERKMGSSESTPALVRGMGSSECATSSSSDVSASSTISHKQTSV